MSKIMNTRKYLLIRTKLKEIAPRSKTIAKIALSYLYELLEEDTFDLHQSFLFIDWLFIYFMYYMMNMAIMIVFWSFLGRLWCHLSLWMFRILGFCCLCCLNPCRRGVHTFINRSEFHHILHAFGIALSFISMWIGIQVFKEFAQIAYNPQSLYPPYQKI